MNERKQQIERKMHTAGVMYDNNRRAQCIALLEEILAEEPAHAEARALLARSYLNSDKIPECIMLSRGLIPDDAPEAYSLLGEAYLSRNQIGEAIFYCNKALDTHPYYLHALMTLISAFSLRGDLNHCKELIYRALEVYPGNMSLLYHAYFVFYNYDKDTHTEHYFIDQMACTGENAEFVWSSRALTAEKEGKVQDAWEFYRRALTLSPENSHFRDNIRRIEREHPHVAQGSI